MKTYYKFDFSHAPAEMEHKFGDYHIWAKVGKSWAFIKLKHHDNIHNRLKSQQIWREMRMPYKEKPKWDFVIISKLSKAEVFMEFL